MRCVVFLVIATACSTASSAPDEQARSTVRSATHSRTRTPLPPAPTPWGDARVTAAITAVRVVAAVDDALATDRPSYARADQRVTLHAVIEADHHYYGDLPRARLSGRTVRIEPIAHAPRFTLAWNRVEPAAADYSNTEGGTFHFAEIDYQVTAIAGAHDLALAADVRPTLTPDHGHGVGTMRFQAVAVQSPAPGGPTHEPMTIASPGPEARRGRGSGGLRDDVMRVSIRRDDTYLGYLTEMFGQPYIWASAGLSDATHESERLEGSDCADFIVYGARRAGKKLAYTWTGGLPQLTTLLASGTRGEDGIYRAADGKPLAFPRPGDLILFPRHVGALVEDRGTIGVLDDQDVMMHTLFDSPKEQAIADSGYADTPVELRRFR